MIAPSCFCGELSLIIMLEAAKDADVTICKKEYTTMYTTMPAAGEWAMRYTKNGKHMMSGNMHTSPKRQHLHSTGFVPGRKTATTIAVDDYNSYAKDMNIICIHNKPNWD